MGEYRRMNTVVELFLEGVSRKEIAGILQRDYSSICKQLQRRRITKRREVECRDHTRAKAVWSRDRRDADRRWVDSVATPPVG